MQPSLFLFRLFPEMRVMIMAHLDGVRWRQVVYARALGETCRLLWEETGPMRRQLHSPHGLLHMALTTWRALDIIKLILRMQPHPPPRSYLEYAMTTHQHDVRDLLLTLHGEHLGLQSPVTRSEPASPLPSVDEEEEEEEEDEIESGSVEEEEEEEPP
jgi:hypothetical protein